MSTATTETLEQEYNRLLGERAEIRSTARAAEAISPEAEARLREIVQRLREIFATPPEGYALPAIAAGLIAHAEAHGWLALAQWTPPGYTDDPFVHVEVARKVTEADGRHRGDHWHYKLTWHSRDCAPGKVRLFGSGLAETPDDPGWHDAPSVKAIRAVIEQHPATEAVS